MEMYMGLVAIVAPRLLYVAVYVTGLVVALARANAHPTASRLAASGFIALILGSLIGIYGSYLTMQPNRPPISELAQILAVTGLLGAGLGLVGTVLIVMALFADRNPAPQPVRENPSH